MQAEIYSILRPVVTRPLCIALAQVMANTPASDARWPMLHRLYNALSPADQLRCRDEQRWCRMAKRGATEARVA